MTSRLDLGTAAQVLRSLKGPQLSRVYGVYTGAKGLSTAAKTLARVSGGAAVPAAGHVLLRRAPRHLVPRPLPPAHRVHPAAE